MNKDSEDLVFEKWFVQWVRSAFKAKGNKAAIHELDTLGRRSGKDRKGNPKKIFTVLYCGHAPSHAPQLQCEGIGIYAYSCRRISTWKISRLLFMRTISYL